MSDNFLKEMLQDIREDVKDLRVSHAKQNDAMNKLEVKVNELNQILGFQKKKESLPLLQYSFRGQLLHRGH